MYGLPKNFDGSILEGATLELIGFAQYHVDLHFDNKVSITIFSSFIHQEHEGSTSKIVKVPVSESNLMLLLGRRTITDLGDGDGTLILELDNGHKLCCLDDSRQYESYTIRCSGGDIVV